MKVTIKAFFIFSLFVLLLIAGCSGSNGKTGATGPQGPAGSNGQTGATGPQGPAGSNGTNGSNGQQGAQGITGPTMPVIQSLSVVGLPAAPGELVTTTVIAQSATNLALTYTWTATSPWIVSPSSVNSQTATITAPSGYGMTGTATIEVSDSNGMYAIGVIALSTQGDSAPVINSITALPNPVSPNGVITAVVN
ncbi:MAG: collagen-like protein, partial [Deltaproteobacteria bacterium]|nr:collagen-like protein [Deltaproteobacteria bacterium]